MRARFEREAKTVSALNHPHICTLHDVGRQGDTDYLVMELVEGETLAQRLARGALPAAEVLKLGGQIADALDRAHRAGVIQLAVFFLRLGYFISIAWGAGLVIAIVATLRAWRSQRSRLAMVIPVYCLSLAVSHKAFFDHKRIDVQPMRWANKGVENQWKQSEVVFEFMNHPGHFVGIYSNDVAEYLNRNGTNPIDVSFQVTSDRGCFRGFHATRIGRLENWREASGYSSSNGSSPFPWKSGSWCGGG